MENFNNENKTKTVPVFKILYKNIWLILICTVLLGVIAFGVSKIVVKPKFTATCNVILNMTINEDKTSAGDFNDDMSLSKAYILTVTKIIDSPVFVESANQVYQNGNYEVDGKIELSAIDIGYTEKCLIFSISYTDKSAKVAEDKLNAFIDASIEDLQDNGKKYDTLFVNAESVNIRKTQNQANIGVRDNVKIYTLIGVVAGLFGSVVFVVLRYFMDNKIKTHEELEELTSSDVLGYL